MPRTASTFFQREVFPKVKDFSFWNVDKSQYSAPFQRLLYQDDTLYNDFDSQIDLGFPYGENILVSNELFVGQSLFLAGTNRSRNAHRLKQIFPNAEIILFLRNQADLLESLYSIAIYSGKTKRPEGFIRFDDQRSDSTDPLYPSFSPVEQIEQYYYTSIYRLYRSKFERVHVFLYEDFRDDPAEFLSNFCRLLAIELTEEIDFGKRANTSLSARQLEYLRRTNSLKEIFERSGTGKRIFRKNIQAIEHFVGGKERFHFPPLLRKKIQNHFKTDNVELGEIVPDLRSSVTFGKFYTEFS
jgi:hypothetical protein